MDFNGKLEELKQLLLEEKRDIEKRIDVVTIIESIMKVINRMDYVYTFNRVDLIGSEAFNELMSQIPISNRLAGWNCGRTTYSTNYTLLLAKDVMLNIKLSIMHCPGKDNSYALSLYLYNMPDLELIAHDCDSYSIVNFDNRELLSSYFDEGYSVFGRESLDNVLNVTDINMLLSYWCDKYKIYEGLGRVKD